METGLTKNQVIEVLTRSPHGDLKSYLPVALRAAQEDPDFFAHLIAWNHEKGAVRDSKIALPVATLATSAFPAGLVENSEAHLALQDPRSLVRALQFARQVGVPGKQRRLQRLVRNYLEFRQSSFGLWERAVLQHRASLKTLYAFPFTGGRATPSGFKDSIFEKALFKNQPPLGSTLHIVQQLSKMPPQEALGYVLQRRIPYLVAVGALGSKLRDPDVVLALINSMSPTELVTNAKSLERLGVKNNNVLRAAFKAKLETAAESGKEIRGSLFKAGTAAKAVGGAIGADLSRLQERQLKATGGVKGRWLILGDKSQSMKVSIAAARFIAGHLAHVAEEVHLCFFDSSPVWFRTMTGKTLEEINESTQYITAGGGTDCLVGLSYAGSKGVEVDGVVIVSDGGHNHPQTLAKQWEQYVKRFGREPTLYFYRVPGGDPDKLSPTLKAAGIEFELFDLARGVDYYSLPNLISTMNTRRWTLIDQILETPLKTLDQVFSSTEAR